MARPRDSNHRWGGSLFAIIVVSLTVLVVVVLIGAAFSNFRSDNSTPAETIATAATSSRPPGVVLPNRALSPGKATQATLAQICTPGYSSSVRDVSTATKNRVYAEYGISHHTTGQYEVDHIIPLEIGGSNDITNLFPEPAEPRPGFHEKDVLENTLHDLVCAHKLDLATAQDAIAVDWYSAYVTYVLDQK